MKKLLIILACIILSGCGASESAVQTAIAETAAAQPMEAEKKEAIEEDAGANETKQAVADKRATAEANALTKTAEYELLPSSTPRPTKTEIPTNSPIPSQTSTPTISLDEQKEGLLNLVIEILENGEGLEDVGFVNLVRFGEPGVLEIEVKSIFASKSNQPPLSFEIIRFLAEVFTKTTKDSLLSVAGGGDEFIVHITTYSEGNNHRYQSETTYDLLAKVANKSISYDEWMTEANAGFR